MSHKLRTRQDPVELIEQSCQFNSRTDCACGAQVYHRPHATDTGREKWERLGLWAGQLFGSLVRLAVSLTGFRAVVRPV